MMVATSSTLHEPVSDTQENFRYFLSEPFRPTLYKWNQKPVFRRLQTPAVVSTTKLFDDWARFLC